MKHSPMKLCMRVNSPSIIWCGSNLTSVDRYRDQNLCLFAKQRKQLLQLVLPCIDQPIISFSAIQGLQ